MRLSARLKPCSDEEERVSWRRGSKDKVPTGNCGVCGTCEEEVEQRTAGATRGDVASIPPLRVAKGATLRSLRGSG